MAKKKNEESVKEVWEKLPEEEKEKISKELEEAASKVEPYSMDDVVKALDKALEGFSERMDQLCKDFADIFCGEEEQEEEKMEPTSKQVINGVNEVEIYQEPVCESTRLTLKNNDDAFEIEINGREAYEFFRRLIFNDHNCNEVRKKNQELADEIIALRKENIELMRHKELREAENKHLREDNMRLKGEIGRCNKVNEDLGSHAIALEKKISGIRKNSIFGIDPVPEEPSSRTDILRCAEKCVCGKREQDYGTPESNFQIIADLWNDYLFPSLKENKAVISAMDVSMMMALMKIARIRNGGGTGDSFVDLAGYAACGGEINARRKQTEKPVSKGE